MSLYAEYIKEKFNKDILENDYGFASYWYIPEQNAVYVEDVYVKKDFRKNGIGSFFINEISKTAKEKGIGQVFVTVNLGINDPSSSIAAILAYGFKVYSSSTTAIAFVKEI